MNIQLITVVGLLLILEFVLLGIFSKLSDILSVLRNMSKEGED